MSELQQFKNEVEEFIAQNGLTPTAFGKRFAGDPLFVFQLREGREPRSTTRAKVIAAMQERAA